MNKDIQSIMASFALPSCCCNTAESIIGETIEYSRQRNPKAAEMVCTGRLINSLESLGHVLARDMAKNLLCALMQYHFSTQYKCPQVMLDAASTCDILTTMTRLRSHKNQYIRAMSSISLKVFPVHELQLAYHGNDDAEKIRERKLRWVKNGALLYGGRMVALATSPIWIKMSNFGLPYPPYDFKCGFVRTEVERTDGIKFGLIKPKACRPELKAAAKRIKFTLTYSQSC